MESVIYEGKRTIWVAVGLSSDGVLDLLHGAICSARLTDGKVLRFYVSTVKTRGMDQMALAYGTDVCLALQPKHIKELRYHPRCHEMHPGVKWPSKSGEMYPVAFLFFNHDLVSLNAVLGEAERREQIFIA